jgi:hypothetical protein
VSSLEASRASRTSVAQVKPERRLKRLRPIWPIKLDLDQVQAIWNAKALDVSRFSANLDRATMIGQPPGTDLHEELALLGRDIGPFFFLRIGSRLRNQHELAASTLSREIPKWRAAPRSLIPWTPPETGAIGGFMIPWRERFAGGSDAGAAGVLGR